MTETFDQTASINKRLWCVAATMLAAAAGACAHAPAVGYGRSPCPISPDARPFSIRVTGDSGIGRDILQTIADALAGGWGSDAEPLPLREAAIFASLHSLIDKPAYHGFGRWRPEPADTGTAQLIYRSGQPPAFRITSSSARSEMRHRMTTSFERAVTTARRGISPDAMPLELPADSVSLAVRFGWEPSVHDVAAGADGLAVFAVNEQEARPMPGNKPVLYPEHLRQMNIEGRVRLAFVLSADGSVDTSTVRTIESTEPEFLYEARRRISGFRYHPAKLNCEPVSIIAVQPLNWRLTR